jgi:sulfite exporter TauE/SafE
MAAADLFVIGVGAATVAGGRGISPAGAGGAAAGRIGRAAARLARLPGQGASFGLGLLMGFLPCGFLYAMLLTAAAGGSGTAGAAVMFSFGLGTAPALLGFGWLAGLIGSRARGRMLTAAGVIVVIMGAYNLYRHIMMTAT